MEQPSEARAEVWRGEQFCGLVHPVNFCFARRARARAVNIDLIPIFGPIGAARNAAGGHSSDSIDHGLAGERQARLREFVHTGAHAHHHDRDDMFADGVEGRQGLRALIVAVDCARQWHTLVSRTIRDSSFRLGSGVRKRWKM